jgi:membrane-bound lytic murein transglycosylase B
VAGRSGRRTFCFVDWDGDGILDLITNCDPNANFFRGRGRDAEGRWVFDYQGPMHPHRLAGHSTTPTPVDWNKDGVPDLLLGAEDGFFYLLPNPRAL